MKRNKKLAQIGKEKEKKIKKRKKNKKKEKRYGEN